ncbi:5455_t:CDS:2, partial [Acaulospora colombiana]
MSNRGDSGDESQGLTHFEPHTSDDSQSLWPVNRILRESRSKYEVEWAGLDPETGKPWKPSWIPKEDCSDACIQDWKEEKRRREVKKPRGEKRRLLSVTKFSCLTNLKEMSPLELVQDREIIQKSGILRRPRSPSPPKSKPSSKPISHDVRDEEEEESQSARPIKKRKKLAVSPDESNSDDEQPSEIQSSAEKNRLNSEKGGYSKQQPPAKASAEVDTSQSLSSVSVVPESQHIYEDQSETFTEPDQPISHPRKNPPVLRPIPQMTPTAFKARLEGPLSQIEEFTSPSPSPKPSRKQLEAASNRVKPLTTSASRGVQQRPTVNYESRSTNDALSPRGSVLLNSEPLPATEVSRQEHIMKVAAKDATIAALEARVSLLQEERERLEKRLQDDVTEHALAKHAFEEQISGLTTALKQFGSLEPAGVEAILSQDKVSSVLDTLQTDAGTDITMAPPPYVRSEEDEALITRLRAENAELQDVVVRIKAEKASSDAMVEQVREVALRAEAARTDMSRQLRIFKEVAQNAPKIAEEMFSSALAAAQGEVEQYKSQVLILEAQNLLTGDEIRKKAAKSDILAKKYQRSQKKQEALFEELAILEQERDRANTLAQELTLIISDIGNNTANESTFERIGNILRGDDEVEAVDIEIPDAIGEDQTEETTTSESEDTDEGPIVEEADEEDEEKKSAKGDMNLTVEEIRDPSQARSISPILQATPSIR